MSIFREVGSQLDRYIWDVLGEERVHDLAGEFLQTPYEASNPHFDDIDVVVHNNSLFTAWLRQDYLYKGKSMLEWFSESKLQLSRDMSRQLDQMIQTSFMSAFIIGNVRPGNIELEDLRSGTRYHVREYSLASQVHEGQLIILRLCQQDDHWEIIMPDGSILPFTLQGEGLIQQFTDELPAVMTMQHTTGYILLRHELGIDPMEERVASKPLAVQPVSKADAAAKLTAAMAETGVDRYIEPATIMRLIYDEFADDELQPQPPTGVRILLGLASDDDAVKLMEAGTAYWNAHVSKKIIKKSHTPDIDINEYSPEFWRGYAKKAHDMLTSDDPAGATDAYEQLFAQMLAERSVTPSLYRLLTNAAVAQFGQGKLVYGRELLSTAQAMCPEYEFAWHQEELLESGMYSGRQLLRMLQESGMDNLEDNMKRLDDIRQRLGPPKDVIHDYSDKELIGQFEKHGISIDSKTFATRASEYQNQYDLAEELTGNDKHHVDAVYSLLDEARSRWSKDIVWVDTLHDATNGYDESVYGEEGSGSKDYEAIRTAQERLRYMLDKADEAVVHKWMYDTREYAGHRQNIVFAALTLARAKPKQTKLCSAALALCALVGQRTGDPIFSVPQLLADEPHLADKDFQKQLKNLSGRLPDDEASLQIIGDQLQTIGKYNRAATAYEYGLSAVDRRRRKKIWQYEPYSYETLADSYRNIGEGLQACYRAENRGVEARKLTKKLSENESDSRLEHNASADGVARLHEDMLKSEAGDSAILEYLKWFDTLEIDLSDGDGEDTVLTACTNGKKIGRNDPCPCGKLRPNGQPMKYKNCCGKA